MLFSSVEFLFLFFPALALLYFAVPLSWRSALLLAASLVFCAWGDPGALPVLAVVSLWAYLGGRLLARRPSPLRLALFLGGLCVPLLLFKYSNALLSLWGAVPWGLSQPLGISFYTFTLISYLVEVYRGAAPLTSPLSFGLYASLFPALVAGPIRKYEGPHGVRPARVTAADAAGGALCFLSGLGKKVLLADPAGEAFSHFRRLAEGGLGTLGAWLGVVLYGLHIYLDFSGYTDMARGVARLLGLSLPQNFDYPYTAVSIRDFWRRWHITLSSFFRDYVYIPLGGSRRGTPRLLLSLLAVWSLTGLWHGATANFLLWGLYYLLLILAERSAPGRLAARLPAPLRRVTTLFFVSLGWVLFAFPEPAALAGYLSALFGLGVPLLGVGDLYHLTRLLPFMTLAALGCTPYPRRLWRRLTAAPGGRTAVVLLAPLLLILCTAYMAGASYTPFLYLQF